MPSVYHFNDFNSTDFTTCCRIAITDDQACCPRCGAEINERSARARFMAAERNSRRNMYGHVIMARAPDETGKGV